MLFPPDQERKDETWVDEYHTRTCNMARKIWRQMNLIFCMKNAESMVWVCDEKVNAFIFYLRKVYKWRSTRW